MMAMKKRCKIAKAKQPSVVEGKMPQFILLFLAVLLAAHVAIIHETLRNYQKKDDTIKAEIQAANKWRLDMYEYQKSVATKLNNPLPPAPPTLRKENEN